MKERKALLEDAKAATQAALEEGIVPGGGVALLRSEKALDKLELDGRRGAGRRDRRATCSTPRCGRSPRTPAWTARWSSIASASMKGKNEGYDADKDDYCDLVEAGIIDPAKVVRTALQNAASVAACC